MVSARKTTACPPSTYALLPRAASTAVCPLSVRSEYIDKGGSLRAANITIPEEHDDTDADLAAAALVASTSKSDTARKPEWVCEHDCSHSLYGPSRHVQLSG